MARLTTTDQACRQRVDELTDGNKRAALRLGTAFEPDKMKVAHDLFRAAQDSEWQDREAAQKVAAYLARILNDPKVTNTAVAEQQRLLAKWVRGYQDWARIAKGYRRYYVELKGATLVKALGFTQPSEGN